MRVGRGISLPQSTSVRNCIQVGHPSHCPLRRPGLCSGRPGTALPAQASPTLFRSHHRRPAVVPPQRSPLKRRLQRLARTAVARASYPGRAPRCIAQNRLLVVSEPRSPLKRRLQRLARTAVARPSHPHSAPRCVAQNRLLVVPEPRPSPKRRPRRVTRTTAGRGASVGRMLFHVVRNYNKNSADTSRPDVLCRRT